MPILASLKDEIDAGKTARLMHPINRPSGIMLTIRIKRERIAERDGYVWQRATSGKSVSKTRHPLTILHATWEALCKENEGMQTLTSDWILCDDPLEPSRRDESKIPSARNASEQTQR